MRHQKPRKHHLRYPDYLQPADIAASEANLKASFAEFQPENTPVGLDPWAIETRLAVLDLGLLLIGTILIIGAAQSTAPVHGLHEGLTLALNAALAFGFAFLFRYLNLEEGRHSLGKALLIGFCLHLMNALIFTWAAGELPVIPLLLQGIGFYLVSMISGWIHYDLSRPFMKRQTESVYFRLERGFKRALDLGASLLGLLVISPLMVLVPIVLCLESKGSPIFTQVRVGEHEKAFRMYKFRSMVKDADRIATEKKAAVLFKQDNDPRITRMGHIIRKLSIDELPQLWNVVRGEMSLVGPRPPLESEYSLMNWYHRRKFEVTPGITGLWQIIGRAKNQRDFNAVAAYDVYYVENWCLMEDLRILLQTIPVVVFQKGAC